MWTRLNFNICVIATFLQVFCRSDILKQKYRVFHTQSPRFYSWEVRDEDTLTPPIQKALLVFFASSTSVEDPIDIHETYSLLKKLNTYFLTSW